MTYSRSWIFIRVLQKHSLGISRRKHWSGAWRGQKYSAPFSSRRLPQCIAQGIALLFCYCNAIQVFRVKWKEVSTVEASIRHPVARTVRYTQDVPLTVWSMHALSINYVYLHTCMHAHMPSWYIDKKVTSFTFSNKILLVDLFPKFKAWSTSLVGSMLKLE